MRNAFRAVSHAAHKASVFFGLAGVATPEAIEGLPEVKADFLLIGMDYRMLAAELSSRTRRWGALRRAPAGTGAVA